MIAFQSQVMYVPRFLGFLVGLAIVGVGVALITFRAPLTTGLNRLYAALPGRFQYPHWWVAFFGSLVCGFGSVIAILSVLFGR
jgi:hypothetical protein